MADPRDAPPSSPLIAIIGGIATAGFVPLILGFSFLAGYLFKLSYFSQLGIPLEFFNHAYFENVSVGTVFVKEAMFTLSTVVTIYFVGLTVLLLFVRFLAVSWHVYRAGRSGQRSAHAFTYTNLIAFGLAVIVFVKTTEAKGTLSTLQFSIWAAAMIGLIFAAAIAGAGRPYLRLPAIVAVILVYFLGYIQYAAQRGTLTACDEHQRTTVEVQKVTYAFLGNFGDFMIVSPLNGGAALSTIRLVKYPTDGPVSFGKAAITFRACDQFLGRFPMK